MHIVKRPDGFVAYLPVRLGSGALLPILDPSRPATDPAQRFGTYEEAKSALLREKRFLREG